MSKGRSLSALGGSAADLEQASNDRLEDARILHNAGRYPSAIAFGLYSLEIAIKVVVCRRLDLINLPRVFETHDLEDLMLHSGLSEKIKRVKRPRALFKNWNDLVQLTKPEPVDKYRYNNDPAWDKQRSERVLHQLSDPPHGLLLWLKKQYSWKVR